MAMQVRFILTMRNVKKNRFDEALEFIDCFILTMRNVKELEKMINILKLKFYINYEECKGIFCNRFL